jgi:hypothetical protein
MNGFYFKMSTIQWKMLVFKGTNSSKTVVNNKLTQVYNLII